MIEFDPKIGPASILAVIQIALVGVGGVYTYAKLENTAENTKETTQQLRTVVQRQRERADSQNDRLINLEVTLKNISDRVTWIVSKIDGPGPKPP